MGTGDKIMGVTCDELESHPGGSSNTLFRLLAMETWKSYNMDQFCVQLIYLPTYLPTFYFDQAFLC